MSQSLIYLDFEARIKAIDEEIAELSRLSSSRGICFSHDIRRAEKKRARRLKRLYQGLSPWQIVQVARHPQRPTLPDYLGINVATINFRELHIVQKPGSKKPALPDCLDANGVLDFRELHGDKYFGDDRAITTGLARIDGMKVMLVGHNKGKTLKEKNACHFGCSNPEGYRKALAKMKLAEKFGLPIVCLIDTPGAYPGIEAEERGQAKAIAENLKAMSTLEVPIVCVVIGEGGSGGALGIGVGDRLAILEFSYFSVISPEGCAAILWRDSKEAEAAANALKLTSKDLLKLGLIDRVIPEPLGGAQRKPDEAIRNVEKYIAETLRELSKISVDALLEERYKKLRYIGNATIRDQPKKKWGFFR